MKTLAFLQESNPDAANYLQYSMGAAWFRHIKWCRTNSRIFDTLLIERPDVVVTFGPQSELAMQHVLSALKEPPRWIKGDNPQAVRTELDKMYRTFTGDDLK
jgi:hypothetical protein